MRVARTHAQHLGAHRERAEAAQVIRLLSRALTSLLALLSLSCETVIRPPGDQLIGRYALTATQTVRNCELKDVGTSAALSFEAAFSRSTSTDEAWVTLQRYSRPAMWDGQYIVSVFQAPRAFEQCGNCTTLVEETLSAAVLSTSQAEAVGLRCPDDGAVPMADEDAGVRKPENTAGGFDSLLACGTLKTTLVTQQLADAGVCPDICFACAMEYRLSGERR